MKQLNEQKDFLTAALLTHARGLNRFAMSLCRDEVKSEDIVAETVLKAFENFHRLKDHDKIKSWLFRILHNQFINLCRRNKNFKSVPLTENGAEDSFSLFENIAHSSFTEEGNPEKDFISKIRKADIEKAISELPEDFRQSLVLCDMEDFTYSEISTITGVPVGTVRSRIARARTILQKKLWNHAREMGIRKSKTVKQKDKPKCDCGEEENADISISTMK